MRREGNIIQEIVEYNNVAAAFDHVVRGERQEYEEGKELLAKREEVIAQLQHEIATGTFTVEEYNEVEIKDLVNLPIVVNDYQLGIKTKEGDDRCVVAVELNGQPKKFITNSEEMKNILSQVSEVEDGFPFGATIKAVSFGNGKTKYVFT